MALALTPGVSAANYLANAQKSLDRLEQVLREAGAQRWPAERILERALPHLAEARQVIASLSDDEGTE